MNIPKTLRTSGVVVALVQKAFFNLAGRLSVFLVALFLPKVVDPVVNKLSPAEEGVFSDGCTVGHGSDLELLRE